MSKKEKKVLKHVTIARDEKMYLSHASVCQAKNGDVLVAFRQAPYEHVFAHIHPEATVGLMRSTDMGETWDPANWTTILDPGNEVSLNDPSITVLEDGTLIVTIFTCPAPWAKSDHKWGDRARKVRGTDYLYVPDEREVLLIRSFDNGYTWEGPFKVDTSYYGYGSSGVFANVVELSDGRLLMPFCESRPSRVESVAALICSNDKGKTWEPYAEITSWGKPSDGEGDKCFGLPSVLAYDDNHMLAVGWSVIESGTLLTSSEDGGKTWSPIETLNTEGACMHLMETKSGTTVMSYGYRHEPFGIRVWASYDKGKTWNPEDAASLRCDGAMRDVGYPWTTQLSNGKLFCAYYFNVDDKDKNYYDEAASLAICKDWNLNPPLYTYEKAGLRFIGGTIFTEEEMKDLGGTATLQTELQEEGPTLL